MITVRITAKPGDVLSAGTMLIQTNDGFTGLDSVPLTDSDMDTVAYDAGTEVNTELAADVPGPPFGGKNHGPDPSPKEPITMHPGITGNADVTPDFKWTGPVAHFTIRAVAPSTAPATNPGTSPAAPITSPPISPTAAALPQTSPSNVPSMPHTGSPDTSIWTLVALAGALFLLGLFLRRAHASARR